MKIFLLFFLISLNCFPFANSKFVDSQSMGSSFDSIAINLDQISETNIHCVYTGTPSGTLKLQASNDNVSMSSSVVNWSDISGTSVAIASAGDSMFNNPYSVFKWIKVVYTMTASTGTINCYYMGK